MDTSISQTSFFDEIEGTGSSGSAARNQEKKARRNVVRSWRNCRYSHVKNPCDKSMCEHWGAHMCQEWSMFRREEE